ncbi:MAG TPA: hypothetical protein VK681_39365 [Reyranella sp.]|nr:hypothetical protein [Reyranella sp.]
MELSTLDSKVVSERGLTIILTDPRTGGPLMHDDGEPMSVTVLGDDSQRMRDYDRKQQDEAIDQAKAGRKSTLTAVGIEARNARRLAVATIHWHLDVIDGQALECTEANAFKVYSDSRFPWLYEQVATGRMERARFFSGGSTS